jgi:hypothetical protein
VRITVDTWDLDKDDGICRARGMIGDLESRMVRLMVASGRINSLEGRMWAVRFCGKGDREKPKENQFKGYYLVRVAAMDKEFDAEMKKLFMGKVVAAVREFEGTIWELTMSRRGWILF